MTLVDGRNEFQHVTFPPHDVTWCFSYLFVREVGRNGFDVAGGGGPLDVVRRQRPVVAQAVVRHQVHRLDLHLDPHFEPLDGGLGEVFVAESFVHQPGRRNWDISAKVDERSVKASLLDGSAPPHRIVSYYTVTVLPVPRQMLLL